MQTPIEVAAPGRAAWKGAGHAVRRAAFVAALSGSVALSAESHTPRELPLAGPLLELSAALPAAPMTPRLSIATRPWPCAQGTRPGETVPRAECGPPPRSRALAQALSRAFASAHAGGGPDALHAAALGGLIFDGNGGKGLDESLSSLREAAKRSRHPARVLADLSAGHLLRAERRQSARDLYVALQLADSAAALDPRSAPALFNRALALDRLALDVEAAKGWRVFLMVEPSSPWAAEARSRLRDLMSPPPEPTLPHDASAVEVAAYARRAPQQARDQGWRLLETWGHALSCGVQPAAADALARAESLGAALERQGGDLTLADAVRAIRGSEGDAAALRRMASAHQAYADGKAADDEAAEWHFSRAAALSESPALTQWAAVMRGRALVLLNSGGRLERGERLVRQLVVEIDDTRYPALAARARWILATTIARTGRYEEAVELHRQAAALFTRAGETQNLGTVQGLAAEILFKMGEREAAHALMHRALATLRSYPTYSWRHNHLYVAAKAAESEGMLRAALRVQDEGIAVADAARGQTRAEAYLARARLRTAAGLVELAAADRAVGRAVLDSLHDGDRGWFEADLYVVDATRLLESDPDSAVDILDPVVAYFDAGVSDSRLLQALVMRSRAQVARGDLAAAASDLARVLELVDEQRAGMDDARSRARLAGEARGLFDRIVMLHLRAGRVEEALVDLERSRSAAVLAGGAGARRIRAPRGEAALSLALIGDTLLAFTATDAAVRVARQTVDRAGLLRAAARADSLLELRRGEAAMPALRALYDRLVRPVEARLGADGTRLTLVADGPLSGVPFAALYDARRERYLVQIHPTRVMASLRDGLHTAPARGPPLRALPPLLVGDPAFDATAWPELSRLAGAATEVDALRALYPGAGVLHGAQATRPAVEAALPAAGLFHFAGHAVADDTAPERSRLVLAGFGTLTAAEIERLDLSGLRLAVLSACRTQRGRTGESGGFAGLAGAFLAAGAGGVVGTLWRVEDGSTRALMVELHRAYRASGDGADALWRAQLALLASADPALRSPATWAAFRYTGM